jgi:hypothetical protein
MHKNLLITAGVVALGIVLGCYVRGYTDAKGWTTATP